jgi:hypothetical protein
VIRVEHISPIVGAKEKGRSLVNPQIVVLKRERRTGGDDFFVPHQET